MEEKLVDVWAVDSSQMWRETPKLWKLEKADFYYQSRARMWKSIKNSG